MTKWSLHASCNGQAWHSLGECECATEAEAEEEAVDRFKRDMCRWECRTKYCHSEGIEVEVEELD